MRLTVYTDYALRVLMYLSIKHDSGGVATIDEMADAYGISRSHLTKIVSELAQRGIIETVRGRAGGARLAREPARITIGEVVRITEKDFAIVECHDTQAEPTCTIFRACNLKRGLHLAVEAFLQELDRMTLADAVSSPGMAAPLLGIGAPARPAIPISTAAEPQRAGRTRSKARSAG